MFKIIVKCIIIINGDNMQEIINSFVNNIVTYLQTFGIPFGCFIVVREALSTNESSIWIAISYSLGFSTGTYIGSILSKHFIESILSIQIITTKNQTNTSIKPIILA